MGIFRSPVKCQKEMGYGGRGSLEIFHWILIAFID